MNSRRHAAEDHAFRETIREHDPRRVRDTEQQADFRETLMPGELASSLTICKSCPVGH